MKFVMTLFFINLITLSACADEPTPAVAAVHQEENDHDHEDVRVLNALYYEGQDLFGKSCGLYISQYKENNQIRYAFKFNSLIHGVNIPATELTPYKYDRDSNFYGDLASEMTFTNYSLAAVIINNNEQVDINNQEEYEEHGELVRGVRVDLKEATDYKAYEQLFSKILEEELEFDNYKTELDVLDKALVKIKHHDHYDVALCDRLQVESFDVIKFNFEQDQPPHEDEEEGGHHHGDEDGHNHDHHHG